jgi:hypothetical protein
MAVLNRVVIWQELSNGKKQAGRNIKPGKANLSGLIEASSIYYVFYY